jgi:hypothetical protein
MGVDHEARASDTISVNAARGRNNTANIRGMSKRRAGGFWIVSVIGECEDSITYRYTKINEKTAGFVPLTTVLPLGECIGFMECGYLFILMNPPYL